MSKGREALHFGAEIRRRREAQNLTLEQLSERSGLTPNYIGGVELDRRDPSLSTILALAKGLGVPAGQLFAGPGELSAASLEAGHQYEELSADAKEAVMMLLRTLSGRSTKKAGR